MVISRTQFMSPKTPPEGPAIDLTQPVKFRIDPHLTVVFVTVCGDVTAAALRAAGAEIRAHPDYHPGMAVYVDCRVVTSIPSEAEVRGIVIERLLRGRTQAVGKLAIVAMTRLGLDLATLFDAFCDDRAGDAAIFTNHDAARAWLGLDAP